MVAKALHRKSSDTYGALNTFYGKTEYLQWRANVCIYFVKKYSKRLDELNPRHLKEIFLDP